MNCKICGKSLFSNITFSNMFKIKHDIHRKCIIDLQFNLEEEVIPIDSNIIIYDYVFNKINSEFNEEYLWFRYFKRVIEKHVRTEEWSMVVFYDEYVMHFFDNFNPYLIINLSNHPILFISLKKMNTIYLEEM